jgi:hypothetical protein
MEGQMAFHMIQIVIHSSFPRRREPISRRKIRRLVQEMDPRLRGDDGKKEFRNDPLKGERDCSALTQPPQPNAAAASAPRL